MSDNTNTTVTLAADDATATALVYYIRASVNGGAKYDAYVKAHSVTRETVKQHAPALASFAYPNEKPIQTVDGKRTTYGNAVQAVATGLRRALGKNDNTVATDYLAKIVKAVESGLEHDLTPAQVKAALDSILS